MKMQWILILLFTITLIVYSISTNTVTKGDTTPARLLPFAILSGRGIYLDDFGYTFGQKPFWLQEFHGHYISAYPMIVGVLAVPFYAPIYLYLYATGLDSPRILAEYSLTLEKITASLFASLSVVLFAVLVYQLMKNRRTTVVLAIIYAFATPTFSISSKYLWQHGIANIFLITSMLFLIKAVRKQSKKTWFYILSLICAVLAGWSRQVFFIFAGIIYGVIAWRQGKYRVWYTIFAVGSVVLFVLYNKYFYGTWLGTSAEPLAFTWSNVIPGIAGLWFSPGRGLLFYVPFFFFAYLIPLYWDRLRQEPVLHKIIYGILYVVILANTAIHAWFGIWWGGWSWGSRFFTGTSVAAVLLTYLVFTYSRSVYIKILIGILILYSCLTQIVGVFYYPRGEWDGYPVSVDFATNRLWDRTDNPITRNLAVGPDLRTLYGLWYRVLHIQPLPIAQSDRACTIIFEGKTDMLGYRAARIALTNRSTTTWYTQGDHVLTLRGLWVKEGDDSLYESPVPSGPLPPVITPGQTVHTHVLLLPPSKQFHAVVIAPVQEDVAWWMDDCHLVISL